MENNSEAKIDVDFDKQLIIVDCDNCGFKNKFKIILRKNTNSFKCKNCDRVFTFDKGFTDVFKLINEL